LKEKRKIAFYQPKSLPISNVKLYQAFVQQFADYHVELIDLEKVLIKQVDVMVINCFYTLFWYGYDLMRRRKKISDAFWRTSFIFKQVKSLALQRHQKSNYAFTFQIQSLFDCSVRGVPHFVYTDHTHLANLDYPSFDSARLFPDAWVDLERSIYNNASLIFVRSSNIKQSLEHRYNQPAEKIERVYAGGNAEIKNCSTELSRYARQAILFVGVDWKRKGGATLIEAFKIVNTAFPRATLTIVGCDPRLNMPNVKVAGRVPLEKLASYYQEASIFCLPTFEEPFGIVFLEAMSAGLPIIGTLVGAIPDFVIPGSNGFIVSPHDVSALAESLEKLLRDASLCKQFGAASLDIVKKNYSWPIVSQKIHQHVEVAINL
jgi:glycosyltransferase involved in cell wall biosynthesis